MQSIKDFRPAPVIPIDCCSSLVKGHLPQVKEYLMYKTIWWLFRRLISIGYNSILWPYLTDNCEYSLRVLFQYLPYSYEIQSAFEVCSSVDQFEVRSCKSTDWAPSIGISERMMPSLLENKMDSGRITEDCSQLFERCYSQIHPALQQSPAHSTLELCLWLISSR